MSVLQIRSRALPPPLMSHPASTAFNARRDRIVAGGQRSPVVRLAAFLLYLVRANEHDGFDPKVIADDVACGPVADILGFTMDDLAAHLAFMKRLGVIEPAPSGGLVVRDVRGLERLAD